MLRIPLLPHSNFGTFGVELFRCAIRKMESFSTLMLSALCIVLYINGASSAECRMVSRVKIDACVATYSTANLFNLEDRQILIKMENTSCPKDITKDSCTSFGIMMKCVNLFDFTDGCQDELDKELKNQQFECTHLELGAICPDADKLDTGSAGTIVVSVSLLLAGFAAAFV